MSLVQYTEWCARDTLAAENNPLFGLYRAVMASIRGGGMTELIERGLVINGITVTLLKRGRGAETLLLPLEDDFLGDIDKVLGFRFVGNGIDCALLWANGVLAPVSRYAFFSENPSDFVNLKLFIS